MRIQCPHGGVHFWGTRIKLGPSRGGAKSLFSSTHPGPWSLSTCAQIIENLPRGPQWTMPNSGQSIFPVFLYGFLHQIIPSPLLNITIYFPLPFSSQCGPAGDQWYDLWVRVWSTTQMLTQLVLSLLKLTLRKSLHSLPSVRGNHPQCLFVLIKFSGKESASQWNKLNKLKIKRNILLLGAG